ncbi:migration and invasion enhancer 1 isoform X1 [Dendroctonus ponderosae]|uniref:migration and invasion enhancer 1 isoform X1 n=1 Tax=Dendroctonus ponderosae TaxID=77166 RepID=UPI00203582BC|nr:migration and invasion enhancer 1 isoform X1 [Dendroctonus ponderosae]
MANVTVEVEYCRFSNKCGYFIKFEELKTHLTEKHPSVEIVGREGRRGSFEVKINDYLVHSKLQTLAYPDYSDLWNLINDAQQGKEVKGPCKQQPITSCAIS